MNAATRTPFAASRRVYVRFSSATGIVSKAFFVVASRAKEKPAPAPHASASTNASACVTCVSTARSSASHAELTSGTNPESSASPTEASAKNTHWLVGAPSGVGRATRTMAATQSNSSPKRTFTSPSFSRGAFRKLVSEDRSRTVARRRGVGAGARCARASAEGATRRQRERREATSSKPPSFFSHRALTSVTSNVAPSDASRRAAASSSRSYTVSKAEPVCTAVVALASVERTPLTLSFAARRVRRSNKPRASSAARARASEASSSRGADPSFSRAKEKAFSSWSLSSAAARASSHARAALFSASSERCTFLPSGRSDSTHVLG